MFGYLCRRHLVCLFHAVLTAEETTHESLAVNPFPYFPSNGGYISVYPGLMWGYSLVRRIYGVRTSSGARRPKA